MLKKNIRLRREYLNKREHQKEYVEKSLKKVKLNESYDLGKKLPTELYKEESSLRKELALDDKNTLIPRSMVDDEYNMEFYKEPSILMTTSRSPSSRLTQFSKEMSLIFPNSARINRGALHINDLIQMAQKQGVTDMILLHEHRGEPDGIIISHLPYGPTIHLGLFNTVLRHDLKGKLDTVSLAYPHLIFQGFTTPLGERVTKILKHLFPIPKAESKRVIVFANQNDIISFRHYNYEKPDHKTVDLNEIGPVSYTHLTLPTIYSV
eukprot:TRINITY_DN4951_c0_g1_i4.p1 TRINITY_DN4951_c0_g1~~TRINITY_DN4951_c0_g1_i4.p1  ORF type:complete len:265 (-),score=48.16 TRINITY_DN4951_c0_g1_i4:34-828(-)